MIGINSTVAGTMALAIASNDVTQLLRGSQRSNWLGVTVMPVRLPKASGHRFGLVLASVESGSVAERASLLPGDILLGTEAGAFASVDDLAAILHANEHRLLRLEFLRGDYERGRKVSVELTEKAAA